MKDRKKESANKGMNDYVGKGSLRKCSRGGGLTEGRERTQAVNVSQLPPQPRGDSKACLRSMHSADPRDRNFLEAL